MKADVQRGSDEAEPQTTLWAVIQKLKWFIFHLVTRQSAVDLCQIQSWMLTVPFI